MGNQKQKWTQDEEDALIAGVEKHGPGKWKNILKDPQFAPFLTSRSNIDLKDKWRNLSVSNGSQGSKDKPRAPKLKALPAPPSATTSAATTATPQNAASAPQNAPSDAAVPDSSLNDQDVKNPPRYNAMVFEALSALKDNNGSDLNAIVSFIEQKHQVPQNFRRALSTRLRRLVSQGKLEKSKHLPPPMLLQFCSLISKLLNLDSICSSSSNSTKLLQNKKRCPLRNKITFTKTKGCPASTVTTCTTTAVALLSFCLYSI
ncbi:telomere repeat-binding factor 4-like isoform X3 [Vigna unguiculata]|uniref:telomere repeat-binding factor 4-like isoform X3 n=1 Tax=Vigna unguiculata TaxID=3917 RepID=UPI001016B12B|nr:telomere repeat-binding factor 4-like isoform X3 [Vigna unguiculata]